MDNAYQSIDSALQENKTIANNILVQTQVNNNRLLIKYSVLFPFDTNILKPTNSKMFGGGFTIVENKTYHLNSNAKVPTLITDLTQSKHILTNYFTGLVTL